MDQKENRKCWEDKMVGVLDANGRTIWVKKEYQELYGASVASP